MRHKHIIISSVNQLCTQTGNKHFLISNSQTHTRKAVLSANWAMSLDILEAMGPGQVCVVSDHDRHAGRTALHMAAFVKPRETAEDVYEEFWNALVVKAGFGGVFAMAALGLSN